MNSHKDGSVLVTQTLYVAPPTNPVEGTSLKNRQTSCRTRHVRKKHQNVRSRQTEVNGGWLMSVCQCTHLHTQSSNMNHIQSPCTIRRLHVHSIQASEHVLQSAHVCCDSCVLRLRPAHSLSHSCESILSHTHGPNVHRFQQDCRISTILVPMEPSHFPTESHPRQRPDPLRGTSCTYRPLDDIVCTHNGKGDNRAKGYSPRRMMDRVRASQT